MVVGDGGLRSRERTDHRQGRATAAPVALAHTDLSRAACPADRSGRIAVRSASTTP